MISHNSITVPIGSKSLSCISRLKKSAYRTEDPLARIACALSHYELWLKCAEGEALMVLEHDARFMHKVPYETILDTYLNFDSIQLFLL